MELSRNKITVIAIALSLMLTISAMFVALPIVSAHDPAWEIPTYAFLSIAPNPVGVGQTVYVNFWLDKVPPTANIQYGDRWQNFTVTLTKPDGTKETMGPYDSDAVGGAWTTYVPDTVGTYTFVFNFPGQTIAGENPMPTGSWQPQSIGDYYKPSTSEEVELIVQEEPIQAYPQAPLPTDYWQRPIFAMNTEWYQISGNWLGLGPVSFGLTGMYN
ncbi:MAG TPA: hypothetical protein VMW91_00520, partial [Desulfosporosinus sp.]|nr:hypothetical protein [Desulfosporosinus sp.]